jgi:beta-glucosidase
MKIIIQNQLLNISKPLIMRTMFALMLILGMGLSSVCAQTYEEGVESAEKSEFKWPEGKKMGLSLTFDDARSSQVEKGIPLLDQYGVKATFYVTPSWVVERIDQWKQAVENGHEIGNHSVIHPCSGNFDFAREKAIEDYTLKSMHLELDSASAIIEELLGVTPTSYAYPCGQTFIGRGKETQSLVPLISSMFESGRLWMTETPNDPAFSDMAQLAGMEMDGKSFEQIKVFIEEAKAKGKWLVLAGHETDEGGSQTVLLETLEAICKYASDPANEIWIDNLHNIATYVKEKRGDLPFKPMLPYQNPALTTDERVEDLLSRMTLKEKIGQLNLVKGSHEVSKEYAEGTQNESIGPVGGLFSQTHHMHVGPLQQADLYNDLQKTAIGNTRLGVPLLITEEGTHGVMAPGATIFPEGQALGSTWNTDLIEEIYATVAKEARAVGIHQLFTLVVEPIRDPRLGRNQEAYSEDPFMCASYTSAIVKGIQGNDVSAKDKAVAGLGHFPGQSEPVSGLERGAMEISERMLREVFLPPWEAGIKESGALAVMATYPAIDGIPTHSSSDILTGILREELGFKGVVLEEGGGIETLVYEGLVDNLKDATALCANAGMDLSIYADSGYVYQLIKNVHEEKVAMETIDRSVRRMLQQKFRLGLFDKALVDIEKAGEIVHQEKHQELALNAAKEGIVLLKNKDNILPLSKDIKSIAVIGPNADHENNQLGDYTHETLLQEITTVLDGIQNKIGKTAKVNYVKGCNVKNPDLNEIDKAVKAAKKSDVAIVVLGENYWWSPDGLGTVGEASDVATLELTGLQKELVQKVHATGTPTVVVMINGRALAINWVDENIPAILEAWNPGEKGGEAIADILFGDVNPSGKLPVTFPRHAGQLPVYYNYKPSKSHWIDKGHGNPYADLKAPTPLYEFGYGLSYTTFEFSNLSFSKESIGKYGKADVYCEIKNTGKMAGAEVAQLYIHDKLSSVVRPVKELKGFKKVFLEPGETKSVTFTVGIKELKMLDKHLDWVVESGDFEVMIGSSSDNIHLNGILKVVE